MVLIKIALALILLGAITMIFSVLKTRKLLQLLKEGGQDLKPWKILFFFMLFFVGGYLGFAVLLSYGINEPRILLTGTVFFFGALFVFIITRVSNKTIGDLIRKNEERKKVEWELLKRETRLRKMNRAILLFTKKLKESEGNFLSTLRDISESSATTLGVERVSIWLYDNLKTGIQCVNLFEKSKNQHSEGGGLAVKDYPEYFKALEEDRVIDAHDAHKDPRTREFSESYLKPLGITSMLDAPVRIAGRTICVLCIEHTGAMRYWNAEEQSFARSMADAVSLAIETSERKKREDEIRNLNHELENRVKERTAELAGVNQNLVREIVRREQMEKILLAREEKYRTIVEDVSDVVYTSDYNGYFTFINRACEKLTGFAPKEFVGKHFSELIDPEWKEEVVAFYLKQFQNRTDETIYSFPIVTKSGEQKWVEQTVKQIRDGDRILEHQCVVRDITLRKKAEEKFKAIFEAAPNIIILCNKLGKITMANGLIEKYFGFSREEIIGKEVEMLIPGRFRSNHKQYLKEFFDNPRPREMGGGRELAGQRKDGSAFPVEILLNPIKIGDETQVLAFVSDITERKKAENLITQKNDELKRSNIELEQFAFIASHDLQEPLRMVTSYVQLLEMRYKDKLDADANDFIHYAVDGSNRMRKLINSLLEYSRLNRIRPFENIKTNRLLEDVLSNLKKAITESNADIKIEKLPDIFGDPALIAQLFQNLIDNAIKFRGEKPPQIIVSGKSIDGYFHFSVTDNGLGISKEYFEKIFVIFQRLLDREKYPGTGIGLAICKKIVERHGGKIWVESATPARITIGSSGAEEYEECKGSTFYFTIKKNIQHSTLPAGRPVLNSQSLNETVPNS